MTRSPYAGRRLGARKAPPLSEERAGQLAARYEQTGNITQCARELGIGWSTARDILARRGMLGQRPAVDENTILRAYDHTGNMTAVGILRGIDPRTVAGILRRHGVPHGEHGPAPQYGSTIRVPAAAQARRRREPSPADLLWPAEAAAAAGVTAAALLDASRSGRLPNHGTEHFPRYRRDQLAELGAGRTISAMQPSKERNDSQR